MKPKAIIVTRHIGIFATALEYRLSDEFSVNYGVDESSINSGLSYDDVVIFDLREYRYLPMAKVEKARAANKLVKIAVIVSELSNGTSFGRASKEIDIVFHDNDSVDDLLVYLKSRRKHDQTLSRSINAIQTKIKQSMNKAMISERQRNYLVLFMEGKQPLEIQNIMNVSSENQRQIKNKIKEKIGDVLNINKSDVNDIKIFKYFEQNGL
ncbi:hypothetical protein A3715_18105 [Oleiphilus sp. HI0009]|nr:hypothetical protein A3715_18105 [Oleiphilus sp. HI0009]